MHLAHLKIVNFRGIKIANIRLTEHFILLGNNNSGKSTIIDAIGLILGKENLVKNIGDWDFFGGNPQPADRIMITGVLIGFEADDESKAKEWFNDINGGIPKWYDPNTGNLSNEQAAGLKLAVEIGFAARFDKEELEFETVRYFASGIVDPFDDQEINKINRDLNKRIGFFLIPSKRNWERIISFGSEIFRKVVSFQEAIPSESIYKIRDDLRNNENGIEKEMPFKEIVDRINNEIKGFSGKESNLSFLPTNADIASALTSITPFVMGRGNTNVPLGSHGSGLVSLQTLLLLLEFGRFRKNNNENFILAAEEPELHMHPGMHRRLIGRIRGLSTQTIISTHSPEIAAYYKPTEINIVESANDGTTKVFSLIEGEAPAQNALMRLFTIYRKETSEALMHQKVIIPEGICEYYWLNKLVSAFITTEGWDITDTISSFGIIPTQDSNVLNTYRFIRRINSFLLPLVDGDNAGKSYVNTLKEEQSPPPYILQLRDGHFLEHIIAWVVLPESIEHENRLKAIFNDAIIDYRSIEDIGKYLANNLKSHWAAHDEIIEAISERQESRTKVKTLIKAFDVIFPGCEPHDVQHSWSHNVGQSTAQTTVLTLSIY